MAANVKAHGMDGTLVEPDWAPLAMSEVRSLLGQFSACGEPLEILSMSPRPFSAASVVATAGGRVFIKRHHRSVRDREGLLEEHHFLAHLYARGARVPRVLCSVSGETAIESGEWMYEVHEAPVAIDLYGDALSWTPFQTSAHTRSAGQALARLHQAADRFNAPRRKPRPLVASFTIFAAENPEDELEQYLVARPALTMNAAVSEHAEAALALLAPFHAELRPLLPALAPLWTHNDLHASNLLWTNAGRNAHATAIIDFGLSDRTNAIHDLAHAIERNIVEWLALGENRAHPERVPIHLDDLRAFLDGYESVRPLGEEEAAALAPMTALCHAEVALSETDYFLGVLHSEEKARMAHEDWLVGHARWFRGAGGERLLDALRKWAAERKLPRKNS
ncbi:MAG TPA: phosphotransferase [Terracidiphilus sp.]|jgi:Ser/Thr protein kinase RdoA (MazF antagonist)